MAPAPTASGSALPESKGSSRDSFPEQHSWTYWTRLDLLATWNFLEEGVGEDSFSSDLLWKERVFVILKGQFTHHFPCKIDHIMTRLSEGMSYSKYMNVRLPSLLSFHPSCPLGCWFWFTYWSFLLPNHCNDQLYTVSYNYCTSSRMNSTSGGEALGNTGGRSECWFWALLSGRLSLVNTTRGCPTIFGVSCKLMPAIFR